MKFSNKILASLLVATSIVGPIYASADTATDTSNLFRDLDKASTWSRDSILQARLLGLLEGDQQGNFRPNDQITRQEMAKILVQLLNLPLETISRASFDDLNPDAWSTPYIEAVRKAEVMQGYGNGNFDPRAVMTREQLAIVFVKALDLPLDGDLTALNRFSDASSIHDWSSQYVAAALKAGLMNGTGPTFGAASKATRQETAMIAVRVYTQKQQPQTQPVTDKGSTTTPGQPSVPGAVVQSVTTAPVAPSIPSPSTGNPTAPTVTPPVTSPNPVDKSMPAIAISRPIHDLNYQYRYSTSASVSSQPITDLDFSIDQIPASATSKALTSFDFSFQGTPATLKSIILPSFDFLFSEIEFTIADHKQNQSKIRIEYRWFPGAQDFTDYISDRLYAGGLDVKVDFDQTEKRLSITNKEISPSSSLNVSGTNANFFAQSQSVATIMTDNSKTFTVNDGKETATIRLNENYTDLGSVVTVINQQLTSANMDASATIGTNGAFTISRTSAENDGRLIFGGSNAIDFFDQTAYDPTTIQDRSKKIEIALADGRKATVSLNQKYDSLQEMANHLLRSLDSHNMGIWVVSETPDTLTLYTDQKGSNQHIRITEGSDTRLFTRGLYTGEDEKNLNQSIAISDGTFTTNLILDQKYEDIEELVKDLNTKLARNDAQAVAEAASPDTIMFKSKAVGKQAKLTIDTRDSGLSFNQKTFVGSGPEVDQAPLIGGVPTSPSDNQFFSSYSLTPVSADTDLVDVELVRSTQTGLDYSVTDYNFPVENYTLGSEIAEEGSYRLTLKDAAGHATVTYFSIETTWPAILSITQQQNNDPISNPYEYDQGDKLTFTLNNFVWKYDSQDQLNEPLPYVDLFMVAALEAALTRNPDHSAYTFGAGAILTTDEIMPGHPAYGRTFTLTLGSGAHIPSTGFNLVLFTSDLISPSGLTPAFPSQASIPALRLPD